MPPELIALIDKPVLLGLVLLAGAAIGIAVERLVESQKRSERRAYFAGRKAGAGGESVLFTKVRPEPTDIAADQLRAVMRASFTARPLLNLPEQRLFAVLDQALAEESPGWRAMGQVLLGEVVASPEDAYFAVNSKRVDLVIVDRECRPLHAIEFQGSGPHTGENTAARDAIKKEALRRAGIGYVEVVSGDTPAEVRGMVRKLVGRVRA